MLIVVHPALVLHVFVLLLFSLMPLANSQHPLFVLSYFWFNALWLPVLYYTNPLFLMEISFLICNFFYDSFFQKCS
jgi:hypothetical protein